MTSKRLGFFLLVIFFLGAGQSGSLAARQPEGGEEEIVKVPLLVEETAGVARLGSPVTTGIPFPQGFLQKEENVRLLDPTGRELPLQTRVLGLWPDKSIRWLLLDFQVDLVAHEAGRYFLEIAPKVKRKGAVSPLKIKRTSRGKEIDTGSILVSLKESKFSIYDEVRLKGAPKWTGRRRPAGAGRRVPIFGPTKPFVEFAEHPDISSQALSIQILGIEEVERGPLRLAVKMKGMLLDAEGRFLLEYESRLEAYARKSFIRVLFTFTNKSPDDYLAVRELSLISLLALSGDRRFVIGGEGENYKGEVLRSGGGRILQETYNSYKVTEPASGGQAPGRQKRQTPLGQGEAAPGWMDIAGREGGILIVLPFFREEYPKALEAEGSGVRLALWPGDSPAGQFQCMQGLAKTHEIYFLFHRAELPPEEVEKEARALAQPLIAVAPSRWYAASGAFGELSPRDAPAFADLEKALEEATQGFFQRREKAEDYGMLNFGDFSILGQEEGENFWGNLEYDLTETLCLLFAHTAERRYFREAKVAARHFMDVDVVHYNYLRPYYEGGVHSPKDFHTGLPGNSAPGLENARIGGLLLYYYLSGEERALEVAQSICRYIGRARAAGRRSEKIEIGSALISLSFLYKATGERAFLNSARRYARLAISLQDPTSGSFFITSDDGSRTSEVTRDEAKLGVLLEGLMLFHQTTGDEAVARCITKAARFVSEVLESRDLRSLPAIFYVYIISGDEKFLNWSRKTAGRAVQRGLPPGGGALAYGARSLLRYQYFLNNLEAIQAEIARRRPEKSPETVKMERDSKRWLSLGDSWLMAGEVARALEYYLKIVQTYPESPYALRAKERIKRIDETFLPE